MTEVERLRRRVEYLEDENVALRRRLRGIGCRDVAPSPEGVYRPIPEKPQGPTGRLWPPSKADRDTG